MAYLVVAGPCALLFTLTNGATIINDPFDLGHVPYTPVCGHACRLAVQQNLLECSSNQTRTTSPDCYASNMPYLTTLAYCLSTKCDPETSAQVDAFWAKYTIGTSSPEPAPQLSYKVALQKAGTPNETVDPGTVLSQTALVRNDVHDFELKELASWNKAEDTHSKTAIILLCTSFLGPIVLSLLRFIPFFSRYWISRVRASVVYPSAWGRRWLHPLRDNNENIPTRGQFLLVVCMIALNTTLASVGHFARLHDNWRLDDRHGKFINCLADRFGVLALANYPLIFLFAGRNNILLYLTNWSHATFLILHRWVAYVATAEAVIHSIIYLWTAISQHKHAVWVKVPAWYTGVVATCAASVLVILSIGAIRRRLYETFLLSHIGISVAVLCGAFFHVYYLFTQFYEGYPLYVWVTSAIWVSDRLIRVVRIISRGVRKAKVTIIDDEYIRVDIPNVDANGHAYLYFPNLTWRVWENHPFSVATMLPPPIRPNFFERPPICFDSPGISITSSWSEKKMDSPTTIKAPWTPLTPTSTTGLLFASSKALPALPKKPGITFYLRTLGGITKCLRNSNDITVLVEGSYGKPQNLSQYPTLLCFAGGVGITAVLPYVHSRLTYGRTKVYWGSRSQALVDGLALEIPQCEGAIAVGRRLDLPDILQRELNGLPEEEPVAVIVSGPKSMADEVRAGVCAVGRTRRGEIRFVDESFGW